MTKRTRQQGAAPESEPDQERPTARTAWFHCFAGISGDMALGALLDAGAEFDEVVKLIDRLPIGGWSLETEPVLRGGLSTTRAVVTVNEDIVVRTHAHIIGLVEEARLPERVRQRSLGAFACLAEAEGRLHRRPPLQVHFHEVGGHDAIVDIVGTAAALEVLGIELVTASAVATGSGMVRTAHGILPNPTPAVLDMLRDVPVQGREVAVELTTPTGAALLAATASSYGPMPAMLLDATGYGAGSRDLEEFPNCTQVVLGAVIEESGQPGQPLVLLESNLDDVTGEVLAHTISALLDAGAYDAWITPIIMKKGRPGHVISVLADQVLVGTLSQMLRDETGSLGTRSQVLERQPSPRTFAEVDVEGTPVRVKVSPGRVKVEHDDAARAARRSRLPLREVVRRAENRWRGNEEGPITPGGDDDTPGTAS